MKIISTPQMSWVNKLVSFSETLYMRIYKDDLLKNFLVLLVLTVNPALGEHESSKPSRYVPYGALVQDEATLAGQPAGNTSQKATPAAETPAEPTHDHGSKAHKKKQDRIREENFTPGPGQQVQMRLAGSLCVGCLLELERKLKLMPGVTRVKINLPGIGGFYDTYTGPSASGLITANLSYDPSKTSIDQLEDFIRTQGYTMRSATEK